MSCLSFCCCLTASTCVCLLTFFALHSANADDGAARPLSTVFAPLSALAGVAIVMQTAARRFLAHPAAAQSVKSCGRRVANIGFAIVWFRIPVTLFNGIGMSLALFGAYCYMRAKQALSKTPPPSPAPGFNRKTL